MENIVDYRTQAHELLNQMKHHQLSFEQIKEMFPLTTDFLKEFASAFKEESNNLSKSHSDALETLRHAIDALKEIGKVENCSDEVKKSILDKIYEISKMVYELQHEHEKNSNKRMGWLIAGLATAFTFIGGLIIYTKNNDTSNDNADLIS